MWIPKRPESLEEAELKEMFVEDCILKTLHSQGDLRGSEIVKAMRLPAGLVEPILNSLRNKDFIGPTGGGSGMGGLIGLTLGLTPKGAQYTAEIKERAPYFGPAPVSAKLYKESVKSQKFSSRSVRAEHLKTAFSDIKIAQEYLNQLGPAINSGGPIFLYGKPGNGKTTMSERIARLFRQGMFIPYAIEANGETIQVFDEKVHVPIPMEALPDDHPIKANPGAVDPRWVYALRPFVVVGGELTLQDLDLCYSQGQVAYQGPFQLKANGGVLLIDDFGRQKVKPTEILNRWIYPLEKQMDFLSLVSGKKIEVPFEIFLIFSTNLDPNSLGDEAFWRRIKYKIETPNPTAEDFKFIFQIVCKKNGIEFTEVAYNHLVEKYYRRTGREFRSVHPRDIINIVCDHIHFFAKKPQLTVEVIDLACASFFGMEETKNAAEKNAA
jgi:predicted ATPase with chaperone activity